MVDTGINRGPLGFKRITNVGPLVEKKNVQQKNDLIYGYRAGRIALSDPDFSTEGQGLYVSKGKDLARFFGEDMKKVYYKKPMNPLIVNNEPMIILSEGMWPGGDIFDPIISSDSEWVKLNKMAAREAGMTDENWDQGKISMALTRLLKEKGYDAVYVIAAGEEWVVLLDRNLWEPYKHLTENIRIG